MKNIQFLTPIQRFIRTESLSGILLFAAAIIAVVVSNLPLHDLCNTIIHYNIGIKTEHFELIKPLILWINDGLMAIFFFLIGLEIKREILLGELNSLKKASLPIFAAIGGMVVPMIMYMVINQNPETSHGWGISMATDIAFTLAILNLLGKHVPIGLKIFLTAFAIIDDLGAVLVIAIFYTSEINWILIFYAGILLAALYLLSFFRIHNKFLLLIFGIAIWFLFLKSGIHPTIAGILTAFAVPIRQRINEFEYSEKLCKITENLTASTNTNKHPVLSKKQIEEIDQLENLTNKVQSPLQQLEHRLHKWVAFLIMPVFAFANAGVHFSSEMSIDLSLVLTIIISLFLGKTIGVFLFSFISIKMKIAALPENINFKLILGAAVLSGVGFTMSLFIGNLAFYDEILFINSAKIGIISGSLISGIIGFIIIKFGLKQHLTKNKRH
ncbi:MAG: Na+/H+ antiporter NhaA [Bacteroidota bacterium]